MNPLDPTMMRRRIRSAMPQQFPNQPMMQDTMIDAGDPRAVGMVDPMGETGIAPQAGKPAPPMPWMGDETPAGGMGQERIPPQAPPQMDPTKGVMAGKPGPMTPPQMPRTNNAQPMSAMRRPRWRP